MKSIIHRMGTAAAVALAGFIAAPAANATRVTLNGAGEYELGTVERYYSPGPRQSGRYRTLGSDYYHSAGIGMERIKNSSARRSGDMSFEFWAMRYYDSTTGIVLMTKGVPSLPANTHYSDVWKTGKAVFIDRYRFPELNLWEFTTDGWKFRDYLKFPFKDDL